jgi:hypothetical protein
VCAVNLQHDCHHGGCEATGRQVIRQEREVTSLTRTIVKHNDDVQYIVNTQSLHNHHQVASALPHNLRQSSFHVADPAQLHIEAAALLRDRKQQQVDARKAISVAKVMGRAEAPNQLANTPNTLHTVDVADAASGDEMEGTRVDDDDESNTGSGELPHNGAFSELGGHAEGTTGAGNLIEALEPSYFPSGHPVFAPSADTTNTHSQSNARKNIPTSL